MLMSKLFQEHNLSISTLIKKLKLHKVANESYSDFKKRKHKFVENIYQKFICFDASAVLKTDLR